MNNQKSWRCHFISFLPESHLSLVVQLRNILLADEHKTSSYANSMTHTHTETQNAVSAMWKETHHHCWTRHVTSKGVSSPTRLLGAPFWNPRRQDSTNCVWWIPVTSAVCHSGSSDWPWLRTIPFDHQDTGIPMSHREGLERVGHFCECFLPAMIGVMER